MTYQKLQLFRGTAKPKKPVVVFLIGMRVNSFWALTEIWAVARAMAGMQSYLAKHPKKGCLHFENFYRFFPFMPITIMYWDSFDALEQFAKNQDDPHLQPWREFNQRIAKTGHVGIWHETYVLQPEQVENIYVNMPLFGLGKAIGLTPTETYSARKRLQEE